LEKSVASQSWFDHLPKTATLLLLKLNSWGEADLTFKKV
jgi:hypothetical protein